MTEARDEARDEAENETHNEAQNEVRDEAQNEALNKAPSEDTPPRQAQLRAWGSALAAAWRGGPRPLSALIAVADASEAAEVQQATWRALEPTRAAPGGWKVGAAGPLAPVGCAPLPAAGLLASGARIGGPTLTLRGIELELALRVARPIDAATAADEAALAAAFDAMAAAIEVVDTRLADWPQASDLAKRADLQSHHALVLGAWQPLHGVLPDLRALQAQLQLDDEPPLQTRGGNPAADLLRLLQGLAQAACAIGLPLQPEQVVTTGSCTGLRFARAGAVVRGVVGELPAVTLHFE